MIDPTDAEALVLALAELERSGRSYLTNLKSTELIDAMFLLKKELGRRRAVERDHEHEHRI